MNAYDVLNGLVGAPIPRSKWDIIDASFSASDDEQWRGIFDFEEALFRCYQEDAYEAMEEDVDAATDSECSDLDLDEGADDYEEVRRRIWNKIHGATVRDDDSYEFHKWIGERFPDYQQKMWELWNLSDYAVFFDKESDTVEVLRVPQGRDAVHWFAAACEVAIDRGINRKVYHDEGLCGRVHRFSTRGAREFAEAYAMKKAECAS